MGTSFGIAGNNGASGKNGAPGTSKVTDAGDTETDDSLNLNKKSGKRRLAELNESATDLQPISYLQEVISLTDREMPEANFLLAPLKEDILARTGLAEVHIARGAVACIVDNGDLVCVLNLHDRSHGDIMVDVNGQRIKLNAGEQLLLAPQASQSFAKLNLLPEVAVRRVRKVDACKNVQAFIADFSIPSALAKLNSLNKLKYSVKKDEQVVYRKLLKTAVALQTVNAFRGSYSSKLGQ
jgi:hypothetical protein